MIAILAVFAVIMTTLISYFVIIYNGLVAVKNNVERAWSNIDVLLKQRHDEIPKLVKVCEGYMKHEMQTLERVIKARSMTSEAKTVGQRGESENMFTSALKSLFAVSENYPELKADKRFAQMQTRISDMEGEIADRRELLNDSVTIYNIRIEKLPDVIVASLLKYARRELWKINPEDRKDVDISFS